MCTSSSHLPATDLITTYTYAHAYTYYTYTYSTYIYTHTQYIHSKSFVIRTSNIGTETIRSFVALTIVWSIVCSNTLLILYYTILYHIIPYYIIDLQECAGSERGNHPLYERRGRLDGDDGHGDVPRYTTFLCITLHYCIIYAGSFMFKEKSERI